MPRAVHCVRVQRGSLVRNAHVPGYLVCSQPFAMSRILESGSTQHYWYSFFLKEDNRPPGEQPCLASQSFCPVSIPAAVAGCRPACSSQPWGMLCGAVPYSTEPGLGSQGFPPAAGAQQDQGPCPATSSPLPKFAPHSLALVGQQPPSSPSLANTSRTPGGAAHFGADIALPLSPLTLLLLT